MPSLLRSWDAVGVVASVTALYVWQSHTNIIGSVAGGISSGLLVNLLHLNTSVSMSTKNVLKLIGASLIVTVLLLLLMRKQEVHPRWSATESQTLAGIASLVFSISVAPVINLVRRLKCS